MIGFCQYILSVEREKAVHIWEHYGISKSVQRKILYLGSWNLDAGFQLMDRMDQKGKFRGEGL